MRETDRDCKCGCEDGITVELGGVTLPPSKANGELVTAKVSQAGTVFAGDFVRRVDEMEAVTELRFVLEGKVVAAGGIGEKRALAVYTQGGKTYAKAVQYMDNALALGNSVEIAGEAVEEAAVVELGDGRAAVLYASEGAGQAAVLVLDGRRASLAYTDLWDDGDPYNIAVSKLDTGKGLVSCLHRQEGGTGQAMVKVASFGEAGITPGPETVLETEYDDDGYSGAWSIAALSPQVGVVSFFRAYAKPVGFAVLDIVDGAVKVRYIGECVYTGSLPTTSVLAVNRGHFLFANGIARVDAGGKVVKSMLGCEVWRTTQYGALPCWYSVDDQEYNASLSRVSAQAMKPAVCITYGVEHEVRGMLIDIGQSSLQGYPGVMTGASEGCAVTVPLSSTYAVLIHQREGNGYAKVLRRVPTALTSDRAVTGLAVTGGGPGEKITLISTQRHTK